MPTSKYIFQRPAHLVNDLAEVLLELGVLRAVGAIWGAGEGRGAAKGRVMRKMREGERDEERGGGPGHKALHTKQRT